MEKSLDIPVFPYVDAGGDAAFCRLQVWCRHGRPAVAMASEVSGNTGRSIMNSATNVWTAVWSELGHAGDLIMIEHYRVALESSPDEFEDMYSEVTFKGRHRFTSPFWRQMCLREIEQLVGRPRR